MNCTSFLTHLANPKFAEQFNLVGKGDRLQIIERDRSGSVFNTASRRADGILGAARLLAVLTGKPDALVGLKPEQLAQISKTLAALQKRMVANLGRPDDLATLAKDMKTAIANVQKAAGTSSLAKYGIAATIGALAITAGILRARL